MEPGVTKILKARRAPDAKPSEGNDMDVDHGDASTETTVAPTSPNAMEVSLAEPIATEPSTASEGHQLSASSSAPQPTAEELRQMRLRRFGAAASTSEPAKSSESVPKPAAQSTPISTTTSSSSRLLSVHSPPSTPSSVSSGTHLTPSATPFNTPNHTPSDSSFLSSSPGVAVTPKSPASAGEKSLSSAHHAPQTFDYNAWVQKTICAVFSVRSSAPLPASATSSFGSESDKNASKSHVFMMQEVLNAKVTNEVPEYSNSMDVSSASLASAPTLFSIDDVDMILMTILSLDVSSKDLPTHFSFCEYLCHCLSRLDGLKRVHPVPASGSPAVVVPGSASAAPFVLVELGNRIFNYFALALTNAPMFALFSAPLLDNPELMATQMVRVLGRGLLPKEHLVHLVAAIGESHLSQVFEPIFSRCAGLARMHSAQVHFDSTTQLPIHAFRALVGAGKPLVNVLVKHPRFDARKPGDTGQAMDLTLLGCLFTYTPLFTLRTETEGSMFSLPMATIGEILFDVVKEAKDAALDWIAHAIVKNKDALKMGAGETLSSTGFANSFSTAMLRMSKPFMDRHNDKGRFANFDANFLIRSKRLGNFFDSSETHIVADKSAFEAWKSELDAQSQTTPYTPTFITECFHMTLLSLALQTRIYRIYADVFERQAEMKRAQQRTGQEPQGIESLTRVKSIIEDVIFAPAHMQEAFLFWEMVGIWLARVASTPDGQVLSSSIRFDPPQLPLPPTPPKAYQCLPEIILDSYANFFWFAALYWEKFSDQEHTDIINSVVTLLASPQYVKNPHIRVKMVQVLTVLMPRGKGGRLQPKRVSPFDSNFVVSNLGPALTHLYCDVERTGSLSQFYDRLNARHELSSILVFLWTDRPGHKEVIVSYWDQHPDSFKSFADKLLNDSIFLLDEGLSKLLESRAAQTRLEAGAAPSDQERRDLQETMERGARQARSFNVLLRESLKIFTMVATHHPRLFMHADMHERLANSLNYCLYQIHGPRRAELRITNPEKFEFEPAWIVDKLCTSILSFATFDKKFVEFLAKDTRSYSDELYMNALAFITENPQTDSEFNATAWKAMAANAKQVTQMEEEMEEELGEIPDDFLDPLMATLMRDPVILPSSGVTVDRPIIERALLADPIDPYNRSPLTADKLMPNVELKAKIDAFIAERRKKN